MDGLLRELSTPITLVIEAPTPIRPQANQMGLSLARELRKRGVPVVVGRKAISPHEIATLRLCVYYYNTQTSAYVVGSNKPFTNHTDRYEKGIAARISLEMVRVLIDDEPTQLILDTSFGDRLVFKHCHIQDIFTALTHFLA